MNKIKEKIKSNFKTIMIVVFVFIGFMVGVIFSFSSAVIVHHTGDKNFCSSCHVMQPMIDAYKKDVHGGANSSGIEAKCVSCHLPHDSMMNYLFTKSKTGLHDAFAQVFYNLDKIDWENKRKHSEHFVYDSGCLECHTNLKNSTMSNMKSFLGHRAYFSNENTKKCVSCHQNVGHKSLSLYLKHNKLNNKKEKKNDK